MTVNCNISFVDLTDRTMHTWLLSEKNVITQPCSLCSFQTELDFSATPFLPALKTCLLTLMVSFRELLERSMIRVSLGESLFLSRSRSDEAVDPLDMLDALRFREVRLLLAGGAALDCSYEMGGGQAWSRPAQPQIYT